MRAHILLLYNEAIMIIFLILYLILKCSQIVVITVQLHLHSRLRKSMLVHENIVCKFINVSTMDCV